MVNLELKHHVLVGERIQLQSCPDKIPMKDIVANIEPAISHLPLHEDSMLRMECASYLNQIKIPQNQHYVRCKEVFMNLRKNKDVYIIKVG